MALPGLERHETSNDTRSRLIREATRLFQMRGYHGVGVTEILQAARLPKGSLYHHFPDGKRQLAIATIEFLEGEVVDHLGKLRLQDHSVSAVLTKVAAEIAAWFDGTGHSQGSILASLTVGLGPGDEALAKALRRAFQRLELALAQLLADGGIDKADAAAREFLITLEGAMLLARVGRDGTIIEHAVALFRARHFAD